MTRERLKAANELNRKIEEIECTLKEIQEARIYVAQQRDADRKNSWVRISEKIGLDIELVDEFLIKADKFYMEKKLKIVDEFSKL